MYEKINHLHFVGIGGIGMSGIAEVLLNLGYRITGSDMSDGAQVRRLAAMGARVFVGHDAAHVDGAHAVVVSSAVQPDNPEVRAARAKRIPVVPRAEMLAELMRLKYGIAVAGTHGKTTTTSIIATLLAQAGLDPTVVNGGVLKALGSNARLGRGEFLVAEADESDGSFLKLNPTIAVVTNIDPEHMEHYGSFDRLRDSFLRFVEKTPFYGLAILCRDHPVAASLAPDISDKRVITYGFHPDSDYQAVGVEWDRLRTRCEVLARDPDSGEKKSLGRVEIALAGAHNVANTLAAVAVARELDVPWAQIVAALAAFQGVDRRFDILQDSPERVVIDDYGHHPVEIEAVLSAVRQGFPGRRVVVLFQPHRFTRVRDLFPRFCAAFRHADRILVSRIYPAGETPPPALAGDAGRAALVEGIRATGHPDAAPFLLERPDWKETLAAALMPGDVVVFLGAGDISRKGREFVAHGGAEKVA